MIGNVINSVKYDLHFRKATPPMIVIKGLTIFDIAHST